MTEAELAEFDEAIKQVPAEWIGSKPFSGARATPDADYAAISDWLTDCPAVYLVPSGGVTGEETQALAEFVALFREHGPALVAEVRKLKALLAQVQWRGFVGVQGNNMGDRSEKWPACPVCGEVAGNIGLKPRPHAPDCALWLAVKE